MIFDVQKSNVFCHKALLWESETREIHSCPNVTILTKAAIASKNRRPLTGATSIYVRQQTLFFCSTSFGANDSTIPCVITQSGRGHNMGGVQIEAPSVHYWHLVVNFTTFLTKFRWKHIILNFWDVVPAKKSLLILIQSTDERILFALAKLLKFRLQETILCKIHDIAWVDEEKKGLCHP